MHRYDLSIGDLAHRTGVTQQTLRSWERRHGFPQAHRTASGHRRYSQHEVDLVHTVAESRKRGLSLTSAIAAAISIRGSGSHQAPAGNSLFALLCATHPELRPVPISKPLLITLSHAIEDEIIARAEPRVLIGTFQRRRFYQSARARWRELASSSKATVVFADFARANNRPGDPIEVPLANDRPLAREWSVIYCGSSTSLCLCAREIADSSPSNSSQSRRFEAILDLDHHYTLEAAGFCLNNTTHAFPGLAGEISQQLSVPPAGGDDVQLNFLKSILRRMLWAAFPAAQAGSELLQPMQGDRD